MVSVIYKIIIQFFPTLVTISNKLKINSTFSEQLNVCTAHQRMDKRIFILKSRIKESLNLDAFYGITHIHNLK